MKPKNLQVEGYKIAITSKKDIVKWDLLKGLTVSAGHIEYKNGEPTLVSNYVTTDFRKMVSDIRKEMIPFHITVEHRDIELPTGTSYREHWLSGDLRTARQEFFKEHECDEEGKRIIRRTKK